MAAIYAQFYGEILMIKALPKAPLKSRQVMQNFHEQLGHEIKNPGQLSGWECCYPDRLYPVPAELSETGVQRKGYTWVGDCTTT